MNEQGGAKFRCRAMGQADLYPFVLLAPAIDKLGFIHRLVHRT